MPQRCALKRYPYVKLRSGAAIPLTLVLVLVSLAGSSAAMDGPLVSHTAADMALNATREQLAAGVPACQGLRLTRETTYVQWLRSAEVIRGVDEGTWKAPMECADAAVRISIQAVPPSWGLGDHVDCSQDDLYVLLDGDTTAADGLSYMGYTCMYSDLYLVATTMCPGLVELEVVADVYDVTQNDTSCTQQKFIDTAYARQVSLLLLYLVFMVPFMVAGIIFSCVFCSGGCCFGLHGKLCCCLQVKMNYAQKMKFVRLINVGGHSRGFTLNLIAAGIIWLQAQLWLPALDPPPGVTELDTIGGFGSFVASEMVETGSPIVKQFSGFVDWMLKMLLCFIIGYAVYGCLMMNYTLRGQDKSAVTLTLSWIFLGLLNVFVAILMVDGFYLIRYFQNAAAFWYFYSALILHTLGADFYAIRLLLFPRFRWNHKYSMLQFRAGNHGGVCRCCRRAWTRFSNWIGEDPAFRYSPWMLAAVLAAFHVLLFSFFTSLFKLIGISDCLKDVDVCLTGKLLENFFFIPTEQIITAVRGGKEIGTDTALANSMEVIYNVTEPLLSQLEAICNQTANMPADMQAALGAAAGEDASANATMALLQQSLASLCATNVTDAASMLAGQLDNAIYSVFGPGNGPLASKLASAKAAAEAAYDKYMQINSLLQELADSFIIGAVLGYTIGLVCGVYVLMLTLAQYKALVKKIKRDTIVRAFTGDAHRETGFSVEEIRRTSDLRNSVYFTGILVSTAFIQLQVAGVVITALVAVLLYRPFWTMVVARFWGYLVSIAVVVICNVVFMKKFLGSRVTDGRNIKSMRGWVAYYIIFSFAQVVFGLLLAVTRIICLLITSLIALNRLDINLFTIGRNLDNGYRSFMGMAAMVEAMQAKERRCWKQMRYIITTPRFKALKSQLQGDSSMVNRLGGSDGDAGDDASPEMRSGDVARQGALLEEHAKHHGTHWRGPAAASARGRGSDEAHSVPVIAPPLYGMAASDEPSELDSSDARSDSGSDSDTGRQPLAMRDAPVVAGPTAQASPPRSSGRTSNDPVQQVTLDEGGDGRLSASNVDLGASAARKRAEARRVENSNSSIVSSSSINSLSSGMPSDSDLDENRGFGDFEGGDGSGRQQ
eukprot:jgi/Tetstr1/423020/TSEL_013795.t1